jgi:ribosomal protein L7Ae-like RNA K-turn-binding protein
MMETDAETREKALGLLGLARRSGKLAVGASAVEQMIQRGKRPVVILAQDAGASQRRRLLALRPVRGFVADVFDRATLAQRLGRGELVVVAVSEPGFVSGLIGLGLVREA